MPETNPTGAKPASLAVSERRERIALAILQAIMTRQANRNPVALAREVVDFTDKFIAAIDTPKGA